MKKMRKSFFKKTFSFVLTLVTFAGLFVVMPTKADAISYSDTSLSAMRERAEEIINYKWTPSSDIKTWNGNKYNGRDYFPKGVTVTGVPYTLFTSEVGVNSLVSLADYKGLVASNYSSTAKCVSMGNAYRTGPVYGSCCADFICEVFGGVFMNGSKMSYHNTGIRNSDDVIRRDNAKVRDIQAGDALCSSDYAHIIWIGDITSTSMTVYEQTPPVARKVVINKPSGDSTLRYNGKTYNIIVRSKQIRQDNNQKYYLDLNSLVDGVYVNNISAVATADVYINGQMVANDCTDFYQQLPAGTSYKITDIRAKNGYVLTGQTTYSGTLWSAVNVNIPFSKASSGFSCNFRMKAGGYVSAYGDPGLKTYVGRIYNNDTIRVLEVYSNGVFKVSCPWDGGYDRIVYASLYNFPVRLTQYVVAYDANWNRVGRGYPNDNCKVLAITSTYVKLACPWYENGRSYTKEIYVRPGEIMG